MSTVVLYGQHVSFPPRCYGNGYAESESRKYDAVRWYVVMQCATTELQACYHANLHSHRFYLAHITNSMEVNLVMTEEMCTLFTAVSC